MGREKSADGENIGFLADSVWSPGSLDSLPKLHNWLSGTKLGKNQQLFNEVYWKSEYNKQFTMRGIFACIYEALLDSKEVQVVSSSMIGQIINHI